MIAKKKKWVEQIEECRIESEYAKQAEDKIKGPILRSQFLAIFAQFSAKNWRC
jgi:hypothetical protein